MSISNTFTLRAGHLTTVHRNFLILMPITLLSSIHIPTPSSSSSSGSDTTIFLALGLTTNSHQTVILSVRPEMSPWASVPPSAAADHQFFLPRFDWTKSPTILIALCCSKDGEMRKTTKRKINIHIWVCLCYPFPIASTYRRRENVDAYQHWWKDHKMVNHGEKCRLISHHLSIPRIPMVWIPFLLCFGHLCKPCIFRVHYQ